MKHELHKNVPSRPLPAPACPELVERDHGSLPSSSPTDYGPRTTDYGLRATGHGLSRPFTLIELLVVVGIMAMLMYIALPAFTKLAKGHGVEYATRVMVGKLGLTRGQAIGKNRYAALLLPIANLPNEYRYSSYRMCFVDRNLNFISWVPNETWEFLPSGTMILEANSGAGSSFPPNDGTVDVDYDDVTSVNCSDTGSGTVASIRAIIFKPSGRMATSGERFLSIGEGKYTGGAPVVTNQSNVADIKIDQYSGRITYGTE